MLAWLIDWSLRNRAMVPTLPKGAGGSPGPCRVERAKGGLALTMAAGPAVVSPNAVLAFGILAHGRHDTCGHAGEGALDGACESGAGAVQECANGGRG